jgi:hypothetical protein
MRGCIERRKQADRKKKEETKAKQERREEKQDVHILEKAAGVSIRCNRQRMGDPGTVNPCSQARRSTAGN